MGIFGGISTDQRLLAPTMPLSETKIKNARYGQGKTKLFDGAGLYLELVKSGSKLWRYKYRFNGKEKRIALGKWPVVTLKAARDKHLEARRLLDQGIDPSEAKKLAQQAAVAASEGSFAAIATEWLAKQANKWSQSTYNKTQSRLQTYIYPWLGDKPITDITAPDVLMCLRRIEERGIIETAHRVKAACGAVFRYAVATGRADRDPTQDLKGALTPRKVEHLATITDEKEIGGLLRAIDGYQGHIITRWALQLAPYVFTRPGELRQAEWSEIDFDAALWRIPAEKMKMGRMHLVPLADQALTILREVQPLTGKSRYVFHSVRTNRRPMSDNTITGALRRLGYPSGTMTGHGFRAMASTRLHEMGWNTDIIERQLAHKDPNEIRASYNHAEYLDDRRKMMQAWADYLDGLKAGGEVVAIGQKTA